MLLRSFRFSGSLVVPTNKWGSVVALPKLEVGHCRQCRHNNASSSTTAPTLGRSDYIQRSKKHHAPPEGHHRLFSSTNTPPQQRSDYLVRSNGTSHVMPDHHERLFSSTNQFQGLKKSTGALPDEGPGVITRALEMIGLPGKLRFNRYKIRNAGLNMYKSCADGIDIESFFRACKMKDTLFSFFLVIELHVWMCMARLKQEGREGKYMTHYMVMSMWHDIQTRGKIMGVNGTRMREALGKMAEQFGGTLFAYDEGLLSTDAVLAAAVWRNLFALNCDDSQQLLAMVAYIRQQMQYLDALDSAKLLQVGRIKWLPFQGPTTTEPLGKAATLEEELDIPEFDKVPTV